MAKKCANPTAGWEWIKYVLSQEGQSKLAELGFALPTREDVAESATFLNQPVKINHQMFLDVVASAHQKPVFKGYDAWSTAFGDSMSAVYDPDISIDDVLKTAVQEADKVLSSQ
jgi:multiple sugar transport system substrate-binding protein